MSLHEGLATLKAALARYQALNYLASKDENYKKVAKRLHTTIKEIDLYLEIAECQRLMSSQMTDRNEIVATLKDSTNQVFYAYELVRDLYPPPPNSGKDATKKVTEAEARIHEQFGKIYGTADLYFAAKESYADATRLYKQVNSNEGIAAVQVQQTKLEIVHDRMGVILTKMKKLKENGNLEEEQLRNVFNKHDRDQSGDISVEEFRGLATDLGTVPELTDEEVAEAVAQIDKSNDAEFSFEELWTWWIQDKL